MYLEANFDIYREDKTLTLTITGDLIDDRIVGIAAYLNNGNEIFLTAREIYQAECILWEEKEKKNHA